MVKDRSCACGQARDVFLHDENEGEERTRRLLGIVLDGLRA
ncbi:hypothetical protein [Pseudonocardia acaciae]|nr:hypothetical protein [Pseudonocardia acaciae]